MEVILTLWTLILVSTSAYERCLLIGGVKRRVLAEKLLGLQFDVRLWQVSAFWRCLLAEV